MQPNDTPLTDARTCTKCGEKKPLERFGQSRGLRKTQCLACGRAYARALYYRDHVASLDHARRRRVQDPVRITAAITKWRQANRDRVTEYVRRWAVNNPERVRISKRASQVVCQAIQKGALTRPSICEECGVSKGRIDAAHRDYSRPLDVRWLCTSCHVRWDRADPKTLH